MKSMDYNPAVITMLRHCYRCHPDILKQSNEIFYDNELVSSADELVAYNMVQYKHLLKKGFPVMFHGIEGKDSREGSSPSWFNADEATLVVSYVTKLLEDSNISVRGEEIGVIAPYQKQVQKIRQALSTGRSTKHGRGRPENPEFKKVQVGLLRAVPRQGMQGDHHFHCEVVSELSEERRDFQFGLFEQSEEIQRGHYSSQGAAHHCRQPVCPSEGSVLEIDG